MRGNAGMDGCSNRWGNACGGGCKKSSCITLLATYLFRPPPSLLRLLLQQAEEQVPMLQFAARRVRNRTKANNRNGEPLATTSEITSSWALAQSVGLTFSGSVRPAVDEHMNGASHSHTKWLEKTEKKYREDGELPVNCKVVWWRCKRES